METGGFSCKYVWFTYNCMTSASIVNIIMSYATPDGSPLIYPLAGSIIFQRVCCF